MPPTDEIVTKKAFAALCNVRAPRVSQWLADGRIKPASVVGSGRHAKINVAMAQADLRGTLDQAMARNDDAGGTNLKAAPQSSKAMAVTSYVDPVAGDPAPDPDDYRARADLPSDFERGVAFAVHRLGHGIPTLLGCAAREHGLSPAEAMALYREAVQDISFIMSDPFAAVGLIPEDSDDSGPFAPTLFGGFNPNGLFS